jgi:hypothetical protein
MILARLYGFKFRHGLASVLKVGKSIKNVNFQVQYSKKFTRFE